MTKKVLILGIDGASPEKVKKLISEGRMPNLEKISKQGSQSTLLTTHASQSPVAWSSFSTGLNPGKHGLYDFITRDPNSLSLQLGLNREEIGTGGQSVYKAIQKGKPFWETLSENNVKAFSLFIPVTFPAKEWSGRLVCGMGTPDLRGTQGVPTLFTTRNIEKQDAVIIENKEQVSSTLSGPRESTIPISFKFFSDKVSIKVADNNFELSEGEWSDWQKVSFNLESGEREGVVRFKLLHAGAEKEVYCSPIMISPFNPFTPISHPTRLSKELAEKVGVYKNNSFESDVHGLKEELINEQTYLEDMYYTLESRVKVLEHELEREWQFGCIDLFLVDRAQHMFMRFVDEKHPYHEPNSIYTGEIDKAYEKIDEAIGRISEKLPKDTLLFVISDHGFGSYRYSVDINKILHKAGLLSYKSDGSSMYDIDWSNTKAFACGFSGIYLNLEGREANGIVNEEEAEELKQKIKQVLFSFVWRESKVFEDVKFKEEIYSGDISNFPELIPYYAYGFRASKATALGGLGCEQAVSENMNKWSGDHIGPGSPSKWAGIIHCNQKLNLDNANIMDLAPTVLEYFGVKPEDGQFDGKSLV